MTITTNNKKKVIISQKTLYMLEAMDQAMAKCRKQLARQIQSGGEIEDGDLAVNRLALLDNPDPMIIPRRSALALAAVSHCAHRLQIRENEDFR